MYSTVFTLATVVGLASAWTYPNCEPDNCYNELTDARFYAEAVSFCPGFLASTVTEASAIPTDFSNCGPDVNAVSSACSCITYTADLTTSATATTTPTVPTTTPGSSTYPTTTAESSTLPTSPASSSMPTYPASSMPTYPASSSMPTYPASSSMLSSPASSMPTYPASSSMPASSMPTYPASSSLPTSSGPGSVSMTTSTVYGTTTYPVTTYPGTGSTTVSLTTMTTSLYVTVYPVSSAAGVATTYPSYSNTTMTSVAGGAVGTGTGVSPPPASTTGPVFVPANNAGRLGGSIAAVGAALLALAAL